MCFSSVSLNVELNHSYRVLYYTGGWLEPSETLCNRELNSAAALLGFDLSKVWFDCTCTLLVWYVYWAKRRVNTGAIFYVDFQIVFHVNMTPQEIADFLLIKIYEHASISTVNPKLQCVCLRGIYIIIDMSYYITCFIECDSSVWQAH